MASTKTKHSATAPPPITGYARVADACQFLAISRATLYRLMDEGELAFAKFGYIRRIPWAALHEYGKRCTVGA
jgi:excisionase family DNA binding protein